MSEDDFSPASECDEVLDELVSAVASVAPQPAPAHPDDAAVDRFAAAMKNKLAKAREKGRSGWETCTSEGLSRMLREHVKKGDPRDVANFCMMLWNLGAGIAAAPQPAQPAPVQQEPVGIIKLNQVGFPYVHIEWVGDAYLRGARHGSKLYLQSTPAQPLTDEQFLELLLRTGTIELLSWATSVGRSIQMQGRVELLRGAKLLKEFLEAHYGIKENA